MRLKEKEGASEVKEEKRIRNAQGKNNKCICTHTQRK